MEHQFVNAQQAHEEKPDEFWAPSKDELDKIIPGSIVKVCDHFERFWVLITAVDGETLVGTVDNALTGTGLEYGDTINIEKKHIYQIFEKKVSH